MAWLLGLPDGKFPSDGVLCWMNIIGISSCKEHVGADDADVMLAEISRRFRHALPEATAFMRGKDPSLAAWLPQVSEEKLPFHHTRVLNVMCAQTDYHRQR